MSVLLQEITSAFIPALNRLALHVPDHTHYHGVVLGISRWATPHGTFSCGMCALTPLKAAMKASLAFIF